MNFPFTTDDGIFVPPPPPGVCDNGEDPKSFAVEYIATRRYEAHKEDYMWQARYHKVQNDHESETDIDKRTRKLMGGSKYIYLNKACPKHNELPDKKRLIATLRKNPGWNTYKIAAHTDDEDDGHVTAIALKLTDEGEETKLDSYYFDINSNMSALERAQLTCDYNRATLSMHKKQVNILGKKLEQFEVTLESMDELKDLIDRTNYMCRKIVDCRKIIKKNKKASAKNPAAMLEGIDGYSPNSYNYDFAYLEMCKFVKELVPGSDDPDIMKEQMHVTASYALGYCEIYAGEWSNCVQISQDLKSTNDSLAALYKEDPEVLLNWVHTCICDRWMRIIIRESSYYESFMGSDIDVVYIAVGDFEYDAEKDTMDELRKKIADEIDELFI